MKKVRHEYVDIAKGIAIFMIVRYHLEYYITPDWLNELQFIRFIEVPVFFVIAGFFLKDEEILAPPTMLKKKYHSLFKKTFWFFLIATLLHNIFLYTGLYPSSGVEDIFIYSDLNHWAVAIGKVFTALAYEHMVGPLWFAYALFLGMVFMSLIVCFIRKVKKSDDIRWDVVFLVFFVVMCISWYVSNKTSIHFPRRYGIALSVPCLILGGKYYFQKVEKPFSNFYSFLFCLITLFIFNYFIGGWVALIVNEYPNPIFLLITSFSSCYVVCYLSRQLYKVKYIGNILAIMGRESYYLMALHLFFFHLFWLMYSKLGYHIQPHEFSYRCNSLQDFLMLLVPGIFMPVLSVVLFRKIEMFRNKLKSV